MWKRAAIVLCLIGLVGVHSAMGLEGLPVQEVILLEKYGGVYHVPVEINGVVRLLFILDTGAAEMSVPADLVLLLRQMGQLGKNNYISPKTFILADGTRIRQERILLRQVKLGNRVLRQVSATVGEDNSPLLLGQNLLEKMGAYTLDPKGQKLVFHEVGETVISQEKPSRIVSQSVLALETSFRSTESTVAQFFQAVAQEKFAKSWSLLSRYSQDNIISMVAKEVESTPVMIQKLFEENHDAVQRGFWSSFRHSSRIPLMEPTARYEQTTASSRSATVQVQVGEEILNFEVFQENGKWKFGLIESLERSRDFSSIQSR